MTRVQDKEYTFTLTYNKGLPLPLLKTEGQGKAAQAYALQWWQDVLELSDPNRIAQRTDPNLGFGEVPVRHTKAHRNCSHPKCRSPKCDECDDTSCIVVGGMEGPCPKCNPHGDYACTKTEAHGRWKP